MNTVSTRRNWLASVGSAALLSGAPTKTQPMQGAFIILSTPYTSAKAVDWEDLAGEVDFLDRCGVHGLVWPQLSSELLQLSKDERMRGMQVLAKAVKGKKPVLVLGVQGDDTKEMLEYAGYAEHVPALIPRLTPFRKNISNPFRVKLYQTNQEYQAGLGFLAGMLFLFWKMLG